MIFVDTGAWVGRFNRRDQYHLKAVEGWRRINQERLPVFTSANVIAETITLLARRISYPAAAEAGRWIYGWKNLQILRSDAADEAMALTLLEKWPDQKIGYSDCISFCLMRRHRIPTAFAFDRHFQQLGFRPFVDSNA